MLQICKLAMEQGLPSSNWNWSQNSMIHETEQMDVSKLNVITYMIIAPAIIAISIVGDLLTLLTLNHPSLKRKKDIYIFLSFLALTDLFTQLSVIPPILYILDFRLCSRIAAFYYAHIAFPLANSLMGASVWVIILLTLYQFKAVCYPLHSQSCNVQSQRKFIYLLFLIVYFCNFCIYAPWAQKKTVYQLPSGVLNCPYLVCDRKIDTPLFLIYEWAREFLTN